MHRFHQRDAAEQCIAQPQQVANGIRVHQQANQHQQEQGREQPQAREIPVPGQHGAQGGSGDTFHGQQQPVDQVQGQAHGQHRNQSLQGE